MDHTESDTYMLCYAPVNPNLQVIRMLLRTRMHQETSQLSYVPFFVFKVS